MRLIAAASIFLLMVQCTSRQEQSLIIGDFGQRSPGLFNTVYLFNMDTRGKPIDSAEIIDGVFQFSSKKLDSLLPFRAILKIKDTFQGREYLRPVGFKNPYLKNTVSITFFMDGSLIRFNNIDSTKRGFTITYSSDRNNKLLLSNQILTFPYSDSSADWEKVLSHDAKLISENSSAELLLGQYVRNVHLLDSAENHQLFSMFSSRLQQKGAEQILRQRTVKISSVKEIILSNENRDKENLFISGNKATLVVLWASWCLPCRKEIPFLKSLYGQYSKNGLDIRSVSIDDDEASWRNAMAMEKMPWRQFSSFHSDERKLLTIYFNIRQIPISVLFDADGNRLLELKGMSKDDESKLRELLGKILN